MRPIAQAAKICFQTPISKLDMAKIAETFAPPVEIFHAGNVVQIAFNNFANNCPNLVYQVQTEYSKISNRRARLLDSGWGLYYL